MKTMGKSGQPNSTPSDEPRPMEGKGNFKPPEPPNRQDPKKLMVLKKGKKGWFGQPIAHEAGFTQLGLKHPFQTMGDGTAPPYLPQEV